jgi:hypothetical protein
MSSEFLIEQESKPMVQTVPPGVKNKVNHLPARPGLTSKHRLVNAKRRAKIARRLLTMGCHLFEQQVRLPADAFSGGP